MDAMGVTTGVVKRREAQRSQFYFQIRNHRQHIFHWHAGHIQDAASHETLLAMMVPSRTVTRILVSFLIISSSLLIVASARSIHHRRSLWHKIPNFHEKRVTRTDPPNPYQHLGLTISISFQRIIRCKHMLTPYHDGTKRWRFELNPFR